MAFFDAVGFLQWRQKMYGSFVYQDPCITSSVWTVYNMLVFFFLPSSHFDRSIGFYFDSQQRWRILSTLPMIRYSVVDSHYRLWVAAPSDDDDDDICQQHCWISLPSSLPKPSFGPNRFIASSDDVSSSPQTNDDSGVGRLSLIISATIIPPCVWS